MHPRTLRAIGLVLLLSAPLLLAAGPGHARALSVEDVIRLHFAGVSEDVIISELIVTDSEFALSVDEVVRLKDAGLSDRLLKFMIDTGLPSASAEESVVTEEYAYGEGDSAYEEEGYGQMWENVIVEEEPTTTTYFATLGWSYPRWYYDCYWYDYWYWDYGYAPYRSSWCVSFGAWYPGWYTARWAWAPAYYGYCGYYYPGSSYAYNQGWADGYAWGYHDGWNDSGGGYPPAGLSDVKYKQARGGSGKVLYADAGLKVGGDVRSLTKRTGSAGPERPTLKTKKVLVADTRSGRLDQRDPTDIRSRPIRIGATETPKGHADYRRTATRTNGTGAVDRKPTGTPTRKPAVPDRPVVTRQPGSAGKADLDRPRDKSRQPSAVTPAPRSDGRDRQPKPKPSEPKTKVAPKSKKAPAPAPQVKRSAPQKAPRVQPSVPRSAPRAQPSAPRSAPRAQPAPSSPSKPRGRGGR